MEKQKIATCIAAEGGIAASSVNVVLSQGSVKVDATVSNCDHRMLAITIKESPTLMLTIEGCLLHMAELPRSGLIQASDLQVNIVSQVANESEQLIADFLRSTQIGIETG